MFLYYKEINDGNNNNNNPNDLSNHNTNNKDNNDKIINDKNFNGNDKSSRKLMTLFVLSLIVVLCQAFIVIIASKNNIIMNYNNDNHNDNAIYLSSLSSSKKIFEQEEIHPKNDLSSYNIKNNIAKEENYQQKNISLWKIKLQNRLLDIKGNNQNSKENRNDIAYKIISKSFLKTYIHLIEKCPPTHPNPNQNTTSMNLQDCMKHVYSELDDNNDSLWWFKTLLRDGNDYMTGLDGPWHYLKTNDNKLTMCTIEKVSTTQWRKVFCKLNNQTKTYGVCYPENNDNDTITKGKSPSSSSKKFVFIRDPLERFLSAYIDKCVNHVNEIGTTKHCAPQIIFQNDNNENNNNNNNNNYNNDRNKHMLKGISNNKKYLFSSYVDIMPLQWDLHFFPQSLYCDGLYRDNHYDFVGTMDKYFYDDLRALGTSNITHHPNFNRHVQDIFQVPPSNTTTTIKNVSSSSTKLEEKVLYEGVLTKATKNVKDYYTPYSLKRVLEYVAIDYIMLNLTLPLWVHEILKEDDDNNYDFFHI